jgi:vitamin B12 transporter
MNIKQLSLAAAVSALTFTTTTNAVLGPIPIYLNTEFRTANPIVSSIASVISLDGDAIQASGANTFLELLASIPSVNLFNAQGNIPAVFLRGTESNHTLVLINGIKVHDISSPGGMASLDNISLEQIERIEIVKGPYSSLYGSNAIGGVIQVFTKRGYDAEDSASINTTIGSNNTKRVSFSLKRSSEKTSINANISNYSTDGVSALTNNDEKDGVKQTSANININYRISTDTSFNIGLLKTNTETEYDDIYGVWGSTPIEYKHNKLWKKDLTNKNLSIDHKFSDNWSSKLNVSSIEQNRQSFTDNIDDAFNTKSYKTKDLTLLNDVSLDSSLLTLGLSKIDDTNLTDSQSLTHKDIFAQWQGDIKGNDLVVGARNTNHTEFGNHTTYNLGLSKKINNDMTASISHGTAFNAPSLYQLYAAWGAGNPNLNPEASKSTEIAINNQHSWGNSSVNLYKTTTDNLIEYSYSTYSYSNIDDIVNIQGVEINTNTNIMSWEISANYNYVNAEKSNTSEQLLRRPKHSTGITANKQSGKYNHRIGIIQKSSSLDVGNVELNGYTLVNAGTKYSYNSNTIVAFKVDNLFNKEYAIANGYNQFGRTITLGLTHNF